MLTTKRLQFDFPHRISFSVFETVMWPKRFELGYLNPFMISTIYQNTLGDYDNMFAGFDFSLGFFDTGEIYGSFMIDETQSVNPLTWFTDPRTIFGLQAGIKSRIPFLPLATAVFQYTRLEPFFYTHRPLSHPSLDSQVLVEIDKSTFDDLVLDGYENVFVAQDDDDEEGEAKYYLIVTKQVDLSYTNKLENLGYFLKPASDECKLIVDTFFPPSWFTRFSFSYIRHADQYGSEIDDYMDYGFDQAGGYEVKAFMDHLVEHTLTASLAVEHQLEHAPLSIKASYAYTHSWLKEESADADWNEIGSHLFSLGIALFR